MKEFMILGSRIYVQGVGWTVLEKGFGGVRISDSYRVRRITDEEYVLYDLCDARFSLKLKRMPLLAQIAPCTFSEWVPDREMESESVPE